MGGEAEGDRAGLNPDAAPSREPAELERIDREKHAVLSSRAMPPHPKPLFSLIDWPLEAALGVGLLGVSGLACVVCRALGASWPVGIYAGAMAFMIFGMIGGGPVRWLRTRQRRRAVMAILGPHRGRVCPVCHYALSSLPSAGQCPECGTLYAHRDVVELWTRMYNLKTDWLESPEHLLETEAPRP